MDTSFHASSLTLLGFIFNCYNPVTFINSLAFGQEACADITRDIEAMLAQISVFSNHRQSSASTGCCLLYVATIIMWHAEGPESQVTLLWNWRGTVAGKCRQHGNYCCSLCQVYSILVWIADETCSEGHYAKWQGLYGSHPLTMNTDFSRRHLSRNANTMFLICPIISHAI